MITACSIISTSKQFYILMFSLQAANSVAMTKSSQLMPLINTGNYRGGTNDKPGPTI